MSLLRPKAFGRNKEEVQTVETDQYIDLGAMHFDDESASGGKGMIKLAEIYRFEDLADLTQPVYDGNVLILDYANIANDTDSLKRITSELKAVCRDTGGDVAAIGHELIVVTPRGIKIDRNKIRGGFH